MTKKKTKYPALEAIAGIHSGIGYVLILVSFAIGGMGLEKMQNGDTAPLIATAIILLGSLYCFFVSQLIQLFIDIESNTRNASK